MELYTKMRDISKLFGIFQVPYQYTPLHDEATWQSSQKRFQDFLKQLLRNICENI